MECHFLILRARSAIVGIRKYAYASTWQEKACHLYIFRVHEFYEVLHNYVHAILMEITMITEREEIEFQTLAFHHPFIRYIHYLYLGKVWLTCDWA